MNNDHDDHLPSPTTAEHAGAAAEQTTAGLSRRRLVRAGLSAAPVVAALHSSTVLANGRMGQTCIRPSTFSSLKAANWQVSQGRQLPNDLICRSHTYWKNGFPQKFAKTKFLSSGQKGTGFSRKPSVKAMLGNGKAQTYSAMTLREALDTVGNDIDAVLARCVAAAFLSADAAGYGSDQIWLTKSQCKQIWDGQGNWSPFHGATWTRQDTLEYFKVVFGTSWL